MTFDDEPKSAIWRLKDATDELLFVDSIYFGGEGRDESNNAIITNADSIRVAVGDTRDVGFAGCLKQLYVGIASLLQIYRHDEIDNGRQKVR
jgi:hypothetical protein